MYYFFRTFCLFPWVCSKWNVHRIPYSLPLISVWKYGFWLVVCVICCLVTECSYWAFVWSIVTCTLLSLLSMMLTVLPLVVLQPVIMLATEPLSQAQKFWVIKTYGLEYYETAQLMSEGCHFSQLTVIQPGLLS